MEVTFTEIDMSDPDGGWYFWHERGAGATGDVDLSQFVGRPIETVEMAESVANEILVQYQAQGFEGGRGLRSIRHDPAQNIWIFSYGSYPPMPEDSFRAAVDGNTGELLRMWFD